MAENSDKIPLIYGKGNVLQRREAMILLRIFDSQIPYLNLAQNAFTSQPAAAGTERMTLLCPCFMILLKLIEMLFQGQEDGVAGILGDQAFELGRPVGRAQADLVAVGGERSNKIVNRAFSITRRQVVQHE